MFWCYVMNLVQATVDLCFDTVDEDEDDAVSLVEFRNWFLSLQTQ